MRGLYPYPFFTPPYFSAKALSSGYCVFPAKGLNAFSVKPIGDYCGQTKVSFGFTKEKNDAKKYI